MTVSALFSRMEEAALHAVVPGLEAEGYQVFLQPSRAMLPPFLHGYRPDAVAIRPDRKIALEVVGGPGREVEPEKRQLASMFAGQTEWELRLVYARDLVRDDDSIPVASREEIEAHLGRVEAAYDAMGSATALLAAWAAFEAAARALSPDVLANPPSTPRLLEWLAREGCITPDEADLVRELGRVRAQIAHGRLDLTPTREQVNRLIQVTREMLGALV